MTPRDNTPYAVQFFGVRHEREREGEKKESFTMTSSSSSSSTGAPLAVDINKLPDDKGSDTEGAKYSSIADLWNHELGRKEEDKESSWYTKASMFFFLYVFNCFLFYYFLFFLLDFILFCCLVLTLLFYFLKLFISWLLGCKYLMLPSILVN